MNSRQMFSFRILALGAFLLPFTLAVADSKGSLAGQFAGKITPESVDRFIANYHPGSFTKLVITSFGGEAGAGMRLGAWIRRNELDVQVHLLCMSACANYVFPAGRKKTIEPGALVLWHGSAEQKNLREFVARYVQLLLKKVDGSAPLSHDEDEFVENSRVKFNKLIEYRKAQATFFDSIQVNEYITRLGQEPVDYGIDSWTTTVRVMEKFGITDVEAPSNYGTPSYVKGNPLALIVNKGKYLTFDLDGYGYAHRVE